MVTGDNTPSRILKKSLFGLISFFVSTLCLGQIIEPEFPPSMSKQEYMSMLIDSLEIAEKSHDTLNVIRYASVLTTRMHGTKIRARSHDYLSIALQYSRNYSEKRWFYEVCNRAGMLMFSLREKTDLAQYIQTTDSSIYWHGKAIESGNPVTQGWGHRGVMTVLIDKHEFGIGDYSEDIKYHFDTIEKIVQRTGDEELIFHALLRYGKFLAYEGRTTELQVLLAQRDLSWLDDKPGLLMSYYNLSHDLIASQNNLDTLISLRILAMIEFDKNVSAEHFETVIEKDQKYQVTKTKKSLTETQDRLLQTSQLLIVIISVSILVGLLTFYFYRLYRKNKKLSQRNDLLLKEQNHRVKNNLQMISSLLSLQSQKLLSTDAKKALGESQSRINSVALLHRMLYEGENIGAVDLKKYLRTLVDEVIFASRPIGVDLKVKQGIAFSIEKATSLGLIVNELLTNSIKHVNEDNLEVKIELVEEAGEIILTYQDNGPGVDEQTWKNSKSFGNQLIRIQAEQLRSSVKMDGTSGFNYVLKMSA